MIDQGLPRFFSTERVFFMNKKQKKTLIRIIVTAFLVIALAFFPPNGIIIELCLYAVPYGIIGHDILIKAFKGLRNRNPFNENFLMAIATIGAFCMGEFREGVAVMLFYQIGELFQSCAVGKSRRSIAALMDIRPDTANLEMPDGSLSVVAPEEVAIDSVLVVRAGERIPIDGIVLEGTSALDTKALTGESLPVDVTVGDAVFGGSINQTGVLRVRTTKEFGESTAAKIMELVESAASKKSKSEEFIAKFARFYTPAVCLIALALAILPPLFILCRDGNAALSVWSGYLHRALSCLVISCPCALVISIPLTFFAGLGGASSNGILIKGSNCLEALSKVRCVVFDKTGTMTKGVFEVESVHHNTLACEELLEYACLAESISSHPIAKSLLSAYGKPIDPTLITDAREISGKGIFARVREKELLVGNAAWIRENGIDPIECHACGTIVHVAIDGSYAGHIVIADRLKPTSVLAVERLKEVGVQKNVMLTGDREAVAKHTADTLRVDEHFSELLPQDKVAHVETLLHEKKSGTCVAFIGDGINDAPVLSRVDVGIAMGALGSDAAIEAADVVLMDDDPAKAADAIALAKKCMRIVYENITFSLFVKFSVLILSAFNAVGMGAAIFADVGVMVLAVLNAVRALRINIHQK